MVFGIGIGVIWNIVKDPLKDVSELILGWTDFALKIKKPEVTGPPAVPLPFRVIEPKSKPDAAFDHLVGAKKQQAEIQACSSMMWTHWREAEALVRKDRRQRVPFLIFSGGAGTGKTAHAEALAHFSGVPFIQVDPSNATFVNSQGLSMIRQVIDYAIKRKSAVILLDEMDTYANQEGFMAGLRQFVDGASQIDDGAIVFVIGTTNKSLDIFPMDLLHRVVLHIPFDDTKMMPGSQMPSCGLNVEQCREFWDRNAKCLKSEERQTLAEESVGLTPRDLHLWVQKVLIFKCHEAMKQGLTPEKMSFCWKDWLGLVDSKVPDHVFLLE